MYNGVVGYLYMHSFLYVCIDVVSGYFKTLNRHRQKIQLKLVMNM